MVTRSGPMEKIFIIQVVPTNMFSKVILGQKKLGQDLQNFMAMMFGQMVQTYIVPMALTNIYSMETLGKKRPGRA